MKKPSLTAVILFGVCAVLWTIRAVFEVANQTYHDSVFWYVFSILCAVIWIAAFVANLKRYRVYKENQ